MTKPPDQVRLYPQFNAVRALAIEEIRIQLDWVARTGRRHTGGWPVQTANHLAIAQRLADQHGVTSGAMLAYLVAVIGFTDDQFDAYIDPAPTAAAIGYREAAARTLDAEVAAEVRAKALDEARVRWGWTAARRRKAAALDSTAAAAAAAAAAPLPLPRRCRCRCRCPVRPRRPCRADRADTTEPGAGEARTSSTVTPARWQRDSRQGLHLPGSRRGQVCAGGDTASRGYHRPR